eukprot:5651320-Alexandrium_andersonii.AAC.1
MSASLVGSEMCIRDRRRRGRCLDLLADDMFDFASAGHRQIIAQGKREAVSYTHLTLPTICSV